MSFKLFLEAIIKFLAGVIIIGLLIFIPAGTLNYINGWVFLGVLFIPMFIAGIIMMTKNPKLLVSRLKAKEKQKEQSIVVKLSGLMFFAGFIVAGLDYRFKWIELPPWTLYVSVILFLLAYLLYAEVLRENVYLSRTIQVQENQKVVDTGLYGIVRHPMYSSTLLLFLTMPLILGSIFSFIIFLAYPVIISFRIINEEKLLQKELTGYSEYMKKIKYRLIPFIW